MTMKWFGSAETVRSFLISKNADLEDSGHFRVDGDVFAGLGGIEVIVGPGAVYYVDGTPHKLMEGLRKLEPFPEGEGGLMVRVL
jgi:hypothetical protein